MASNQCPNCKCTFENGDDHLLRRLLDKIKFKCLYNSYGCPEKHNYSNYEHHLQSCDQRLVNCEFCKENIKHSDLDSHYRECSKFKEKCKFCQHTYSRDEKHDRIDCLTNKVKLLFEMFNFLIRGQDFIFKSCRKVDLNQNNYDTCLDQKVKCAYMDIENS